MTQYLTNQKTQRRQDKGKTCTLTENTISLTVIDKNVMRQMNFSRTLYFRSLKIKRTTEVNEF